MPKITIDVDNKTWKDLENLRKTDFSYHKKIGKMLLELGIKEIKKKEG